MGAFYRAGAPFDWYLAEDLDAVLARNYKVVVFLDCQYMTETQRRQVEALKCNGRTLVFFHVPGYVSQTGRLMFSGKYTRRPVFMCTRTRTWYCPPTARG